MKRQRPADVEVTDEMRAWAQRNWDCPFIPDVFIADFKAHHESSGKTFADAGAALRNWIRWASPSGRFYRASEWEAKLSKAKTMHASRRHSQAPTYTPHGYTEPHNERSAASVAQAAVEQMRARLAR